MAPSGTGLAVVHRRGRPWFGWCPLAPRRAPAMQHVVLSASRPGATSQHAKRLRRGQPRSELASAQKAGSRRRHREWRSGSPLHEKLSASVKHAGTIMRPREGRRVGLHGHRDRASPTQQRRPGGGGRCPRHGASVARASLKRLPGVHGRQRQKAGNRGHHVTLYSTVPDKKRGGLSHFLTFLVRSRPASGQDGFDQTVSERFRTDRMD